MIKKPTIRERYKDVAHFDQIVENGTTYIDSIFMFKSPEELFPFMLACRDMNSTVVFKNEDLVVSPDDSNKWEYHVILSLYCTIAGHPEIVKQYTSYLLMEMEKGKACE